MARFSKTALVMLLILGTLVLTSLAAAQTRFTEIGHARGLETYLRPTTNGSGVSVADFDKDGDLDLFVGTQAGQPNHVYRNVGNARFVEVAAELGLSGTERTHAALWIDLDGDSDLDLVSGGECGIVCQPGQGLLRAYVQNADGRFSDATEPSGLYIPAPNPDAAMLGGLAAGDLDGDGFLDLVVAVWRGTVLLFLNNGDGTFREASTASGLDTRIAEHYQPVLHDFNGDGRLDLYIAVDALTMPGKNALWINRGNGTFVDRAEQAGLAANGNEMGLTVGDYDNDGDLDLYVTNIFLDVPGFLSTNSLYRQDGTLYFTEHATALGVADAGFAWGTTFFDADNDGWLDLAVTNGGPWIWEYDPSKLFLNSGHHPVAFEDASKRLGFNDTLSSIGLAAFDADRDGDLDLVQTSRGQIRLLINRLHEGTRYLVVRPRMRGPNSHAIGAQVRAHVGTSTMTRLITAGTSFFSQEPAEAFFGLGDAEQVDGLEIRWPDGKVSWIPNVAANQVLEIDETAGEPRQPREGGRPIR